jgi:putative flippase GtrA
MASTHVLARSQLIRFAVVGTLSNISLFVAYLGLTFIGLDPKLAMTLVYSLGVVVTYAVNSAWSFRVPKWMAVTFGRYLCANALGYLINLALLWLFVDRLAWPHQFVQAVAIVLVALVLFALNRHWVFSSATEVTV